MKKQGRRTCATKSCILAPACPSPHSVCTALHEHNLSVRITVSAETLALAGKGTEMTRWDTGAAETHVSRELHAYNASDKEEQVGSQCNKVHLVTREPIRKQATVRAHMQQNKRQATAANNGCQGQSNPCKSRTTPYPRVPA